MIFIYLILASQFGSFLQPVAIMVSLPLSLIGVFLALLLTGHDAQHLLDDRLHHADGARDQERDPARRLHQPGARRGGASLADRSEAGQVRLRPILMTTMAMIFGMLPIALGVGEGGETQAPMGRAVIGGIITSTLLTLVVVPVLYTYLDGWSEHRKARRERKAAQAPAPHGCPGTRRRIGLAGCDRGAAGVRASARNPWCNKRFRRPAELRLTWDNAPQHNK